MSPLNVFWDRCEGPIVYGANDCCMTVADVIVAAGGPDLMEPYRGRYQTSIGFIRAFRKTGYSSVDAAATARFRRLGYQVDRPKDFDVAMVTYADGNLQQNSPAFYHSGFWCLRSERGGICSKGHSDLIWRLR